LIFILYDNITGGDAAQMVNNVADGFQYTETQIGTASDFKAWIKDYMNAVVLKLRYALLFTCMSI
jgi:hypothetical protein